MSLGAENTLEAVRAVYSGAEGDLWELVMGEQIHIGGFESSMDLAERAGIGAGHAGRRPVLLQRRRHALPGAVPRRRLDDRRRRDGEGRRARPAALPGRGAGRPHPFILADVCESGLPDGARRLRLGRGRLVLRRRQAALIAEAARLVKPGGMIAFTDWVEERSDVREEAAGFLRS